MSQPTPKLFIDTVFAYQKTAAIEVAIGLGLFHENYSSDS
jgi:hypothetical protein